MQQYRGIHTQKNYTMKKNIIRLVAVVLIFGTSLVCSCTKQDEEVAVDSKGTIYGTITDYDTGEPIGNANVKLRPSGETTLTGSDGTYEFNNLKADKYTLSLSKAEYIDLDDDYVIHLETGKRIKRDVQMQKYHEEEEYESFKVLYNGREVDTIVLGQRHAFSINVVNDGTLRLELSGSIVNDLLYWNGNDVNGSGTLYPGDGLSWGIGIDEDGPWHEGENTEIIYVNSSQITKMIVVKVSY